MKPLFFSLLITMLSYAQATATSLLPVSLEQLSSRAALIFYGTVINNYVKKDAVSGHIVTFTEFEIIELIKGNSETRHTIKQLGGQLTNSRSSLRVRGVPRYKTGEQYIVFLPEKSALGFCSPLGLHQGSFSVTTLDGEKVISNGHQQAQSSSNIVPESANKHTTVSVPLAVKSSNPTQANLDDFINSIRAYNTPD